MNYYEVIDPLVKGNIIDALLDSISKANIAITGAKNHTIHIKDAETDELLMAVCIHSRRVLIKSDTPPVKNADDQIEISKEEYDALVEADHLEEE
jgi:hypothetical protein